MQFRVVIFLLIVAGVAKPADLSPVKEEQSEESERISIFKSLLEMDDHQKQSEENDESVWDRKVDEEEESSVKQQHESGFDTSPKLKVFPEDKEERKFKTVDLFSESGEGSSKKKSEEPLLVDEELDRLKNTDSNTNKFALGETGFDDERKEESPSDEIDLPTTEKAKIDKKATNKKIGFFKKVYSFFFGQAKNENESSEDVEKINLDPVIPANETSTETSNKTKIADKADMASKEYDQQDKEKSPLGVVKVVLGTSVLEENESKGEESNSNEETSDKKPLGKIKSDDSDTDFPLPTGDIFDAFVTDDEIENESAHNSSEKKNYTEDSDDSENIQNDEEEKNKGWSFMEWIGSFFTGNSEEKSKQSTEGNATKITNEDVDNLRNDKYNKKL